ncbi:MAG: hypothetical protein HN474_06365 [Nitrospina sp.]|nr:hypothetical protein [Nitrospina sp.]
MIFSVKAIQSWPPLIGKVAILLPCLLPATMIAFVQVPAYFREKKVPKEILWVFLIFILALTSSLLNDTPLTSFKATGLFFVTGPFIFITTIYLFKSTRNQTVFLWMISLSMLCFGAFYLVLDFNNSEGIFFSDLSANLFHKIPRNPLPAAASLILLSAGPMILLTRKTSPVSRMALAFGLILSVTIIVLLSKKGPALSLIVIVFFWAVFINLKHLKVLLGLVLLTGCLLYFSESTLSKYKSVMNLNTSVTLRAELIFFGIHIFKQNPVWGISSRTNLNSYTENYKRKIPENLMSDEAFHENLRKFKTFENIFLAFLVEMGGLFSITYFGGLLYIMVRCLKISRLPSKDIEILSLVSVIVGFLFISCTFDTLRFPNLNWLFHSLLGLMVNLPQRSVGDGSEAN